MEHVLAHFQKVDPQLHRYALLTNAVRPLVKKTPDKYFATLCEQIVCQQLSSKAGDAIFAKFTSLFSADISPQTVLQLNHDQLRSSGISHAKANYVVNIAQAVSNGQLPLTQLDSLSDSEIISLLTQIKGIGPWTAEMFLMFTLGREDVFSIGDLGLRHGIQKIYEFKTEPSAKKINQIASRWSPYKTYASRVLWASLEL